MHQLIKNLLKKLIVKWSLSSKPEKLQLVGFVLLIISVSIFLMAPRSDITFLFVCLAFSVYGTAFLIWIFPVKDWLQSEIGNFFIKIVHVFVGIFAIAGARYIVFNAIGLPPQYFDLTVAFIALFIYVPAYLLLIALLFSIFFVFSIFISVIWSYVLILIGPIFTSFQNKGDVKKKFSHLSSSIESLSKHALGSVFFLFLFGWAGAVIFVEISYLKEGIRYFAFFADFQPAGKYPGVPCDARIRIQDNGVVAVARKKSDTIEISISRYEENQQREGCSK